MASLLELSNASVLNADSAIAFATTGGGSWPEWDRYLTVNGQQAYHLGNVCGTCAFLFQRLAGANAGIRVGKLTSILEQGVTSLSPELIDTLAQLMPNAEYRVALLRILPQQVQLGGPLDYFAAEQVENEGGIDPFWGLPHDPRVPYYRIKDRSAVAVRAKDNAGGLAFDFIVPMFPDTLLNEHRIRHYESLIRSGRAPTAVSVSLLDVKGPASTGTDHWCMAHYLLDGHHKVAAAARVGQEITLLSFVAVDQGASSPEQVDVVLGNYFR
ncbi:hypothetical protein [Brevundimonas sp. FT23042]|uniref:hypothetical protein n=1 Tax=Brevundimonas sp. FT23042 TaxID=3393749 RepID=UPI003B58942C